jgi:hypothetical protein
VKVTHRRRWYIISLFTAACSGARTLPPSSPPSPLPTSPVIETPATVVPGGVAPSFNYAFGTLRYRISRSASIETTDSVSRLHREVSTNITNELLTLDTADRTSFTAVIDTFATTTQGLIGSAQSVQLPVRVSGSFTGGILRIDGDATGGKCTPLTSALQTDLHNLLVAFPQQLTTGISWQDSTDVQGCQAGVPTLAHTIRSYSVVGSMSYQERPVLVILRTDSTRAKGEGGLQQHRISIEASGAGTARYYLDTEFGRVVHITTDQALDITVTASARTSRFRQISKQEFAIAP